MKNFSWDIPADINDNLLQYKVTGLRYSVMVFTQIIFNMFFENVQVTTF